MRLASALVCLAVLTGYPLEQPQSALASADQTNASSTRRGIVRLADQVFIDDNGPFLGVGATLFWAGWGYQHDRARLEQNLDFLAKHGVDYIRVLGVVGPRGWPDRTVAARSLLEGDAIQGLTDLVYSKGMRVEWTIFGGLDTTPTAGDREALVHRFASALDGRAHKVQHFEVVNEGYSTGWRD